MEYPTLTPELAKQLVGEGAATSMIATRVVYLTPDAGDFLLSINEANYRKLKPTVGQRYSGVMSASRWRPGVADVGVSVDGELQNGQHVCWAVSDSQTTQIVKFTTGLPVEAADAYDTNLIRTAAQVLAHHGIARPTEVGSTLRHYMSWQEGVRNKGTFVIPTAAIIDVFQQEAFFNQHVHEALEAARELHTTLKASVNVLAALYLIIKRHAPGMVDEFFAGLSGIGVERSDPRHVALRTLNSRANRRYGAVDEFVQKAVIIQAFNAWASGQEERKHFKRVTRIPELTRVAA